ncbi:MAG: hypothetical protein K8F90_20585 [Hyphomicrobiales bacterium]|nr:hypothetical protein [Hyphomicrobiales bacterium]
MYKIIIAATFIAATTYAAVAKEVCYETTVRQINCKTVNGKQSCSVSYEPAQVCRQVPDKPANSAARTRPNQMLMVQE